MSNAVFNCLLQHCTVQYHEQENNFIVVLPTSWWSAGVLITLTFSVTFSVVMTAPGGVASIYVKFSVVTCFSSPRWRL